MGVSSQSRHLLDIRSLSQDDLVFLLSRSSELARGSSPEHLDRCVANLFFEPSTRTRVSFELAARRLGAEVINIELARSSASKGESLLDTAATLVAMGVDALVLRHPDTGEVHRLASALLRPVVLINAGDGQGDHPSQALLDAATLQRSGLDWSSATVAIVGDIRHSRVARSNIELFTRLGVGCIRLAGPPGFVPAELESERVERVASLEQAIDGADAVMMLRIQHERMDQSVWPDRSAYAREWCLTPAHLELARPDCRVLHPGPINRELEIDSAVADGPRSLILEQVRMGVFSRMAVFEWLLG